jgi:hypothetical protein
MWGRLSDRTAIDAVVLPSPQVANAGLNPDPRSKHKKNMKKLLTALLLLFSLNANALEFYVEYQPAQKIFIVVGQICDLAEHSVPLYRAYLADGATSDERRMILREGCWFPSGKDIHVLFGPNEEYIFGVDEFNVESTL